jgi:uncharacterized membrane protein
VVVSGVAEIAGGLAVIPRVSRRAAGLWLVALLVAVFPANIYMALRPDEVAKRGVAADRIPVWLLYLRLPIQPLIAWWAWRATNPAG